jgi:hypothetical protein
MRSQIEVYLSRRGEVLKFTLLIKVCAQVV